MGGTSIILKTWVEQRAGRRANALSLGLIYEIPLLSNSDWASHPSPLVLGALGLAWITPLLPPVLQLANSSPWPFLSSTTT